MKNFMGVPLGKKIINIHGKITNFSGERSYRGWRERYSFLPILPGILSG